MHHVYFRINISSRQNLIFNELPHVRREQFSHQRSINISRCNVLTEMWRCYRKLPWRILFHCLRSDTALIHQQEVGVRAGGGLKGGEGSRVRNHCDRVQSYEEERGMRVGKMSESLEVFIFDMINILFFFQPICSVTLNITIS